MYLTFANSVRITHVMVYECVSTYLIIYFRKLVPRYIT